MLSALPLKADSRRTSLEVRFVPTAEVPYGEERGGRLLMTTRARGEAVMSRLAIAFVLALAATVANAQDTKSEQSQAPAVVGVNGTRPFLFDARMPGDGVRRGALPDDHQPNAGAIVVPPKASQPGRER
jgi:hypothetical protein